MIGYILQDSHAYYIERKGKEFEKNVEITENSKK